MHIVHVIARLNDGGPARVLAALGSELARLGWRSTVLAGATAADERDLTAELRAGGMEVETVPGLGRRLRPLGDLTAGAWLVRRLKALRPDVVHTHTFKAGVLGRLACRRLQMPCLHTFHGHVLAGHFPAPVAYGLRLIERALAPIAHLHALTPGQRRELCRVHRIGTPRRWHVLPVPVAAVVRRPAAWHAALGPGARIGFLGRLAPVKDADLWLEALAQLARLRPVQGVLCGDGGERPRLEARARALGVAVHVAGFVPAGEALAAMDLLLVSSRNEGLPLAVIEAAGVGVPVVAPAVGGLVDLAAWGAVLAAPRTPLGLAAACLRLLDDGELRQAQLARAAALAHRLRPQALAPRYAALYSRVHREG